jgi:hypothetical protein
MPPLLLVLGLFSVRIALAGIARPGRDELAYWYWAWHSLDAGYSLVTLSAVRISTTLCGDGAWAMRLPGLLAGVASAFLFHRIARRGGGDPGTAAWLTLAFVASPWQGYVGGVVHPDAFLGLGLLLFADGVTAGERRGAGRIATGACLAGLSKLTGALLLPVAAVTLLRRGGTRGRRIAAAGALLLVAGLFAVSVQPGTLRGVDQLGTFAVGTPLSMSPSRCWVSPRGTGTCPPSWRSRQRRQWGQWGQWGQWKRPCREAAVPDGRRPRLPADATFRAGSLPPPSPPRRSR